MKSEIILQDNNKSIIINNKKTINMYVCGPTVYNHVHIGNIRPLIIFDVLYRHLKYLKYKVKYVQNITDIDDKIIAQAKIDNVTEKKLVSKYIFAYKKICEQLNILPFKQVRVSNSINLIEKFINKIINSESGYEKDGNVYFEIAKDRKYGEHSNKILTELSINASGKNVISKRNELDFVLWKKTSEGLKWKTKWSIGRPGWHTECAAIVANEFKNNLTIHGGGIDLKFPHHENEIAQYYSIYKKPLAEFWMYVGHVNFKEVKMSKSLKNFVFAKDVIKKFGANVVRLWMFTSGYQSPLNYDETFINEIKSLWFRFLNTIYRARTYAILNNVKINKTKNACETVIKNLSNNLNLPNFLTDLQKKLMNIDELLNQKQFEKAIILAESIVNTLTVLGFVIKNVHSSKNVSELKKWNELRNLKKFKESDNLRKKLIKKNLL